MKFKEIIKWIEKVGGDVVSFIKLKPYIALIIAGTVAAAGITIYHCASSSDNDKNIEINMDEINEEQKYTEVKMLYDDTVFMNGNNIFSDTEREENRNFLDTIKEKIDDKTLSNDEIDRLETLNELLTNIAATNKKSMEDALGQIKTQYLIISDGDETVEGYTVISVSKEEKPKAPKYTKEQNDLINNILNQWFDLEISEEEANAKLRSSFPGMNMVTKHIGNEAEARALWNSLGDEYLKSNILISNKYGSYFIYGK